MRTYLLSCHCCLYLGEAKTLRNLPVVQCCFYFSVKSINTSTLSTDFEVLMRVHKSGNFNKRPQFFAAENMSIPKRGPITQAILFADWLASKPYFYGLTNIVFDTRHVS